MFRLSRLTTTLSVLVLALSLSTIAHAANDASIKGDLRSNIQHSMQSYIDQKTIDDAFYVYDSVKGRLLKLELDELHDGIVKKGDFYVSCADFKDQHGRKIDVDFMVRSSGDHFVTTQALVHSIDGEKRKYHLEKY